MGNSRIVASRVSDVYKVREQLAKFIKRKKLLVLDESHVYQSLRAPNDIGQYYHKLHRLLRYFMDTNDQLRILVSA